MLPVRDYALAGTLTSGQAFRWRWRDGWWEGVIAGRWVRLREHRDGLEAEVATPVKDWTWLRRYLRTEADLEAIVRSFPDDAPLRASVAACRGLRLLRQEPWECLASFLLSATKQIVQIQQIVEQLCRCYGEPVAVPPGHEAAWAFPAPDRLAGLTEAALRNCKTGFRAPRLREAARRVAAGELDLAHLSRLPLPEARARLLDLPGVGPKIADCVLLFSGGFDQAFPVDVWVMKALRQLYFPRRRPKPARLRRFIETYFGPHAGWAQQYLFCYMRRQRGRV